MDGYTMRCRPLKAIGTLAIIGVAGVSRRLVLVDGLEVSPTRRTISTAQFSTRPTRALLPTPRRDVVEWTVTAAAAATVALVVNVPPAAAAAEVAAPPTPMETVNVLLNKLKNIPTFCIVDSQDGAAYMAFKPDQAMAIGYAFTTFPGALADAQRVAKEKNYAATWERATVTTLPLDIAVRLSLKKRSRVSQKEQTIDSLLQVIPGADERQDGIALDSRFQDQGRVPLFYVPSQTDNNGGDTVVYFSRLDLIAAWNQDHSAGTPLPSVKTLDLVGLFEGILRGRANAMPCPTAQQMVFVPNAESVAVAKEMKVRGGLASYNPGKMIV